MIRQLLSSILIVALLGSQAVACCGHSHVGSSNHALRAHIHLSGHDHGPDHHHDHGLHDHDLHHDECCHPASSESVESPCLSFPKSVSHEDDAIYFAQTNQELRLDSSDISLKKSPMVLTVPELMTYGNPERLILSGDCTEPHPARAIALFQQTNRLLL